MQMILHLLSWACPVLSHSFVLLTLLALCFHIVPLHINFLNCYVMQSSVQPGNLLRFSIRDEAVRFVDGKLEIGDMQFTGKPNRGRAFADSYSKVCMKMLVWLVGVSLFGALRSFFKWVGPPPKCKCNGTVVVALVWRG